MPGPVGRNGHAVADGIGDDEHEGLGVLGNVVVHRLHRDRELLAPCRDDDPVGQGRVVLSRGGGAVHHAVHGHVLLVGLAHGDLDGSLASLLHLRRAADDMDHGLVVVGQGDGRAGARGHPAQYGHQGEGQALLRFDYVVVHREQGDGLPGFPGGEGDLFGARPHVPLAADDGAGGMQLHPDLHLRRDGLVQDDGHLDPVGIVLLEDVGSSLEARRGVGRAGEVVVHDGQRLYDGRLDGRGFNQRSGHGHLPVRAVNGVVHGRYGHYARAGGLARPDGENPVRAQDEMVRSGRRHRLGGYAEGDVLRQGLAQLGGHVAGAGASGALRNAAGSQDQRDLRQGVVVGDGHGGAGYGQSRGRARQREGLRPFVPRVVRGRQRERSLAALLSRRNGDGEVVHGGVVRTRRRRIPGLAHADRDAGVSGEGDAAVQGGRHRDLRGPVGLAHAGRAGAQAGSGGGRVVVVDGSHRLGGSGRQGGVDRVGERRQEGLAALGHGVLEGRHRHHGGGLARGDDQRPGRAHRRVVHVRRGRAGTLDVGGGLPARRHVLGGGWRQRDGEPDDAPLGRAPAGDGKNRGVVAVGDADGGVRHRESRRRPGEGQRLVGLVQGVVGGIQVEFRRPGGLPSRYGHGEGVHGGVVGARHGGVGGLAHADGDVGVPVEGGASAQGGGYPDGRRAGPLEHPDRVRAQRGRGGRVVVVGDDAGGRELVRRHRPLGRAGQGHGDGLVGLVNQVPHHGDHDVRRLRPLGYDDAAGAGVPVVGGRRGRPSEDVVRRDVPGGEVAEADGEAQVRGGVGVVPLGDPRRVGHGNLGHEMVVHDGQGQRGGVAGCQLVRKVRRQRQSQGLVVGVVVLPGPDGAEPLGLPGGNPDADHLVPVFVVPVPHFRMGHVVALLV